MIASSGFATFFVTELGHGIDSLKNLRVKVYFFHENLFLGEIYYQWYRGASEFCRCALQTP